MWDWQVAPLVATKSDCPMWTQQCKSPFQICCFLNGSTHCLHIVIGVLRDCRESFLYHAGQCIELMLLVDLKHTQELPLLPQTSPTPPLFGVGGLMVSWHLLACCHAHLEHRKIQVENVFAKPVCVSELGSKEVGADRGQRGHWCEQKTVDCWVTKTQRDHCFMALQYCAVRFALWCSN